MQCKERLHLLLWYDLNSKSVIINFTSTESKAWSSFLDLSHHSYYQKYLFFQTQYCSEALTDSLHFALIPRLDWEFELAEFEAKVAKQHPLLDFSEEELDSLIQRKIERSLSSPTLMQIIFTSFMRFKSHSESLLLAWKSLSFSSHFNLKKFR